VEAAALVLLATRDAHKDGHGLGGGGSGDGDGGGGSGGKATSRKGRRWPNLLDLPAWIRKARPAAWCHECCAAATISARAAYQCLDQN
jgi:hypothetical protein